MPGKKFYFDPDARGPAVFMGQSETRLMELAWKHKQLTVKKVLFYLNDNKPAYTTVMTILGRLADKGLLKKTKEGRTYYYTPAAERRIFLEEKIDIVISCLNRNFKSSL